METFVFLQTLVRRVLRLHL